MRHLDDGILFEILVRLPAKSLLRFRCVDKRWLSLISDPALAKAQLRMSMQQPTPPQRLLVKEAHHAHFMSVHIDRAVIKGRAAVTATHRYIESRFLVGDSRYLFGRDSSSCHGLLYLQDGDGMFLYNPTTSEWRKLPEHPLRAQYNRVRACGFGYDAMQDDYKILSCTGLGPKRGSASMLSIFSLKSNSWRNIREVVRGQHIGNWAAYLNGFWHWLVRKPNTVGYGSASFNIRTEQLFDDMLPLPNFELPFDYYCGLTGLGTIEGEGEGGSLIAYRRNYRDAREVWIMNCCGPSPTWTKLWFFRTQQTSGRTFPLIKEGNIELCGLNCGSLHIYNPREDSWEKMCDAPTPEQYSLAGAVSYVESLIPLHVN